MMTPKRILIVEDDAIIAMDLQFIAEDAGWQVIGPAGTLDKGMDLAEREDIDFALLDMNLRNTTSFPIAQALARKNVPAVFLSGSNGDNRPDDIKTMKVLAKPLDSKALVNELEKYAHPASSVAQ